MIAPLTGDGAGYGQYMLEGFRLKSEAEETLTQLGGKKIELMVEDDAGKPEDAVSAATKLINQDNVNLLVASIFSPTTMAIQPIAAKARVPQLTPSSTAAAISQQGNPWIFRVALPDTVLGMDLARFVGSDLKLKRVGFLSVNDDFGKGGYEAFVAEATKLGLEISAAETYGRGDKDFTAQLTKIKSTNPEALVQWSRYAEAALISQQARQPGYSIPMLGSDAHAAPKFLELAGSSAEGSYYVGHWSITAGWSESKTFVERYRARYGREPDQYSAQGYTSAELLVDALKRAPSADRAALRDALAGTKGLKTAMGTMQFNEQGDLVYPTFMVRIVNGRDTQAGFVARQCCPRRLSDRAARWWYRHWLRLQLDRTRVHPDYQDDGSGELRARRAGDGGSVGRLDLITSYPLPYPAVLVLAVLLTAILSVAIDWLIYRPVQRLGGPTMNVIITTIGVTIVLRNAAQLVWGSEPLRYPPVLGADPVMIGGIALVPQHIAVMFGGLAFMVALQLFFLKTRTGWPCGRWLRIPRWRG